MGEARGGVTLTGLRGVFLKARRLLLSLVLVLPLFGAVQVVFPQTAHAYDSATACAYPSTWHTVYGPNNTTLTDVNGENGISNNQDMYAPSGDLLEWQSTGVNGCFFFRMQLAASAVRSSRIDNNLYIVGLGSGNQTRAYVIVNGQNSDPGFVEIYDGSATPVRKKQYVVNGAGGSTALAYPSTVGSNHYIAWQVPYNDLRTVLDLSDTGNLFGFFAGTGQASTFVNVNKDCLGSSGNKIGRAHV